jgi:hypothetical protein
MNKFELASKVKLRFNSGKGLVSVEDLWDLPLTGLPSLNSIAISIYRSIKSDEEESFVSQAKTPAARKEERLQNIKLDIVKHIINAKEVAADAAAKRAETKALNQKLMGIIEAKEDDALAGKSLGKLKAMLEGQADLDDLDDF